MLTTLIPIWQFVIIPGILVGIYNKRFRLAILSGLIGVTAAWNTYILFGIAYNNVYLTLDQFGALLIGSGYGWLIVLLIILFGALFGLLGGGIGNLTLQICKFYLSKRKNIKN
jgi:hypothetical protein